MENCVPMKIIAHMNSPFPTKFGIPRQSGLVESLQSRIVFEPAYRVPEAFRGLEGYSHIWIIWQFSEAVRDDWSPTIRPPRLGGNARLGVFASRSPFRPNAIGLSAVKLERIDYDDPQGPVLLVSGADLMDGTPVFDIKPYLPYADAHPEATGGFALQQKEGVLQVDFSPEVADRIPFALRQALTDVLAQDPRPQYHKDPQRIYGMAFAGLEVRFSVKEDLLTVISVEQKEKDPDRFL